MIAIARDAAAIQNQVAGAIRLVAADMECHLRVLGQDYLRRGEPLPDWLMDELAAALELQGSI